MLRKRLMACGLAITIVSSAFIQCVPDTSDSEVNPALFVLPVLLAANRKCTNIAISPARNEVVTFTAASPIKVMDVPVGSTSVRIVNGTNNQLSELTTFFRAAQCLNAGDFTDIPFSSFRDVTIPVANQPQLNMFFPSGSSPTSYTVQVTFN